MLKTFDGRMIADKFDSDFFECSAKTGQCVQEAFTRVVNKVILLLYCSRYQGACLSPRVLHGESGVRALSSAASPSCEMVVMHSGVWRRGARTFVIGCFRRDFPRP